MCDRPLPGRCRSSPPSTSSAYERCLPESRPKAERFTPVRRRSDELCSGCRCPKWWKECPGTTPGFHGNRSGSAEDYSSRRRVPGRRPGLQKSTPTEIRSGTAQHRLPPRETCPSRRPDPARTVPSRLWGAGLGRPAESSGLGPPMGLTLAKLRELAQSTLPSLREGSRRAGPQQQSRLGGQGTQSSPSFRARLGCACSCQKRSPVRCSRHEQTGAGEGA